MQTVVIVVHLMIVLTMIGFVMLQRSEGGGLGMGSGGGGFMSSRGTANVLTRVTGFLAMAFFATSLTLSLIAGLERKPRSILDGGATPASQIPGAPAAPIAPPGGGLLDTLRGGPPSAPGAPAPPSGPQVPQSK
jgi:preprotein translocase subunit SecG